MIFKHQVKYNGVYYPAGTDVPVGVKPVEKPVEVEEDKYTKTDINRMAAAELKELAGKQGIDGAEEMTGAELKKALIEHYGL